MYKINYDFQGKPCSIQKDNMSIPMCEDNTDFQQFLEWNKRGKLDYKTPIAVEPPAPVETLDEKISKIVDEKLKAKK